jgi:DNA-binding HxlR family transcriptional regulator
LSIAEVKPKGETPTRAGTKALSLIAAPLNVAILQALAAGPITLIDLRRATGSPSQTTLRKSLRYLTELGALQKTQRNDFPGPIDYELTKSGRELLEVASVVGAWLSNSPHGSVPLGSTAAKSAINAFVDGWSTSILRALAARPLSLTELDSLIAGISYPSLERRLGAMRLAGQVEKCRTGGRGTPYVVTDWLRAAIAPLVTAVRWERRHMPEHVNPVTSRDVEGTFLLALPSVRLPQEFSGSCRLAVEVAGPGRLVGALAEVERGAVIACTSRLDGAPSAWVVGSIQAWLRAVVEHDPAQLDIGGSCDLANALIDSLGQMLFSVRRTSEPNHLSPASVS